MAFDSSQSRSLALDAADPLSECRRWFHIPPATAGSDPANALASKPDSPRAVYLTGNSLGLQPRSVQPALLAEMEDWAAQGVEGHIHGRHPWLSYHRELTKSAARLVGALDHEVVVMNSLTVNLHLMMVSFYRPTRERFKIIIEDSAFPSDSYAVASQAKMHGLDPAAAIVRLKPRDGEHALRTEDIIAEIQRHGSSVALVMLGAVNYLTGQWFDMPAITKAAQAVGAIAGWDLAHAAGNVPLQLHEWGADFACWCGYKYLNSGPGALAGIYVHERHVARKDLQQCAGWWGNDEATRFRMGPEFSPVASAERWQLSNPPIFSMTPVRESLAIFDRVGMSALRRKSEQLTAYLESHIDAINAEFTKLNQPAPITVLTPRDPARRGCQLSLVLLGDVKEIHRKLSAGGVIVDFREPNVIRAAPVPLYNTFNDVWQFAQVLGETLGFDGEWDPNEDLA